MGYKILITCIIICGCVTSPMVYRTYIELLNKKYNANAICVNFKDKRKGLCGRAIAVKFDDGTEYYNSILDDDYCVSIHSRYIIVPSCITSMYRSLKRGVEIFLGDFWAIEIFNEKYDDNKGTYFVLVNTSKGESFLNSLDIVIHPTQIDYEECCMKYNWCIHRNPYPMPEEDRKVFFQNVVSIPFDQMSVKEF